MKIFLAGDEGKPVKASILDFHPYSLFSYHYFKEINDDIRDEFVRQANAHRAELICDSGLFTFMFGAGAGSYNRPHSFWEDYTKQYIETARSWGFTPGSLTLVECDTHKVAPIETLYKIREKYFERCEFPVQYVWHIEEGIDGLKELARRYDFIGISVLELKKLLKGKDVNWKQATRDIVRRLLDHAAKGSGKRLKIHLLGNTVEDMLKDHLCYSSDSTSWIAGIRFGNVKLYDHGSMRTARLSSVAYEQVKKKTMQLYPRSFDRVRDHYHRQGKKCPEYILDGVVAAYQYALYQNYLDRNFEWKFSK